MILSKLNSFIFYRFNYPVARLLSRRTPRLTLFACEVCVRREELQISDLNLLNIHRSSTPLYGRQQIFFS